MLSLQTQGGWDNGLQALCLPCGNGIRITLYSVIQKGKSRMYE